MDSANVDRQLASLAGLGDPLRRALYRHVAERGVPVSRDEAAEAVGIGRPLAAYHLDKLVDDGLLQARYRRRGSRLGPGAGRPAKHYVRADRQIEISLPARGYEPCQDADGIIRLHNCPFDRIAAGHRQVVCGASQAMLQALADHLSGDRRVRAVLDPQPGRCCVALTCGS